MDRPAIDLSSCDEARAEQVARHAGRICAEALALLAALEATL